MGAWGLKLLLGSFFYAEQLMGKSKRTVHFLHLMKANQKDECPQNIVEQISTDDFLDEFVLRSSVKEHVLVVHKIANHKTKLMIAVYKIFVVFLLVFVFCHAFIFYE